MARMVVLVVVVACVVGCADDGAEGRYGVQLTNGDNGCGYAWDGGSLSTDLEIGRYEDSGGEHYVANFGFMPALPGNGNEMAMLGFYGGMENGELILDSVGRVEANSCVFVSRAEIRAEYQPNRTYNLAGGIDYTLTPLSPTPCAPCTSHQDFTGVRCN